MKYPRTLHLPSSPAVQGKDVKLADYSRLLRRPVILTEKIDGTCVGLYDGNAYTRTIETKPSNDGWLEMVKKHHAWKTSGDKQYIVFGEDIYGRHAIEYAPVWEDYTFRLFAVFDLESDPIYKYGSFLSWRETEAFAINHNMTTVPVLHKGEFEKPEQLDDHIKRLMDMPSELNLDGPREGVVVRMADTFVGGVFKWYMAKYVRENHVYPDAKHWRKNWKPCNLRRI